MDTKQLAYFVAVAKYRNFSRAAEEFHLTQPAISHQIKMLERELSRDLFVRNTKKVTLTDHGVLFLEEAKDILSSVDNAKKRLIEAENQPVSLRICHLAAPSHLFLPDVINQFHKKYPRIKIRLIREDAYTMSESVSRHDADIYFSIMSDLVKYTYLDVKKIHSDSFCLVTRKDHPILKSKTIDFKKLSKEPFLIFDRSHARYMNNRIKNLCNQIGFYPNNIEQYDLYENILHAVESGLGISILPYRSRHYMNTNSLSFTPIDGNFANLDLGIGWEHNATNSAVKLFVDMFKKYMKKYPEFF